MVCPKCRRIYPDGVQLCSVDGTPLAREVGDFPTGFDDGHHDRTTATGEEQVALAPVQITNTPIGREGSVARSLTDSRPVGREISTPRMMMRDLQIGAGDLIADYQITGRLGEGGMGTVYAGIQPVIGKPVAIKVLLREFASNAEVVNRFIQEARAANQARSRYIVDIFSFGELNDGRHYFVMEHLDGQSLREVLTAKKIIPFDEANSILSSISKGLLAAHGSGIIHRDIKPENIMVIREEDGTQIAKILDFGIAKLQGTQANPDFATKTGAAMGTPFYMSPEQCRGVDVDHRTDIYALGIIMFEMFTGQLPFKASSYIELVNKHLFASPPPMQALNPEISAQLEAFILRCIAKNPDERPQSMKQFLLEFKELVPSLHSTPPGSMGAIPAGTTTGPGVAPTATPGRSRVPLVLGLLAVVVLVGGGAGAYLMFRDRPRLPVTTLQHDSGGGGASTVEGGAPAVPQTAVLGVTTVPAGATIFINERQHPARSPTRITLPPGKTRVRLVLEGYGIIEEQPTLEPGQEHTVSIKLIASPAAVGSTGSLAIRTNLQRATFYLDGTIVHQGPTLKLDRIQARAHQLRITALGYRPLEQAITILQDKKLELQLTLERKRHGPKTKTRTQTQTKDNLDDPDVTLNPFKKTP